MDTAEAVPVVEVRDLTVSYQGGPPVLSGVDFDLYPGEIVALLGASGSGKSTLMRALTGFVPATAVSLQVVGTQVQGLRGAGLAGLRADVGQVFQDFNLVGQLSVLTNVLTGALHRAGPINWLGGFSRADRVAALELLDRIGIVDKAGAQARSLSGGQQQRVAIARALMQQPSLILADEPVASLDPSLADSVLGLLRQIAHSDGIPVLVSLHQVDLALAYSDRIVGLRQGSVAVTTHTAAATAEDLAGLYGQAGGADDF